MTMSRPESGTSSGTRVVECAIMAVFALLAGDALRSEFAPLWQALRLLLGN
jgi:hypothetical protein